MRGDAPPLEASVSGLVIRSHLDVWLGGDAVAVGVPVGAGSLIAQVDQDVPERLDASVPREWDGVILDPGNPRGVLGAAGHEVQLWVSLSSPDGSRVWRMPRGRFQVHSWDRDGAGIRIEGRGLLQIVQDQQRDRPWAPGRPSPIAGEVTSLLATAGLDWWLDPGLSLTRRVPADFVQGEDIWAALNELLTAWPARARMGDHGQIRILPALSRDLSAPEVWWHDGEGGTVTGAPMDGTRDGTYNHVMVKVKPEGDDAAEFWVEDHIRTGPLAVGVFKKVTQKVETDAVTTRAQAELVAINELAKAGLRAKTVPVEMVPDWRVELDDVVHVKTADGLSQTGRVTGIELPLTNDVQTARVDVGVVD